MYRIMQEIIKTEEYYKEGEGIYKEHLLYSGEIVWTNSMGKSVTEEKSKELNKSKEEYTFVGGYNTYIVDSKGNLFIPNRDYIEEILHLKRVENKFAINKRKGFKEGDKIAPSSLNGVITNVFTIEEEIMNYFIISSEKEIKDLPLEFLEEDSWIVKIERWKING